MDSHLLLTDHKVDNGNVVCNAVMQKGRNAVSQVYSNVEFLTYFSVTRCDEFYSDHLEQLAKACPNLQQLNLLGNVNCLKSLRGLCAIANHQNLQGLNIAAISVQQVESCVRLWKILVDLQLTNVGIDICCLLCFEDKSTSEVFKVESTGIKLY